MSLQLCFLLLVGLGVRGEQMLDAVSHFGQVVLQPGGAMVRNGEHMGSHKNTLASLSVRWK